MKRAGTGAGPILRETIVAAPDGTLIVSLAGAIDENSDLPALFARLTGDCTLNMQAVERVNSMGIHRWIPLVTKLSTQHRLVIEEISYALVQNANVVANMFGTARVTSCMAPYFCATCKANHTVVVTSDEVKGAAYSAPVKSCPRCKAEMEFDELDGYFGFFKGRLGR